MKRYQGPVIFLILFVCFGFFVYRIFGQGAAGEEIHDAEIAIVLYSGAQDRWRSLEQGVRQACDEIGIEKPVLTEVRAGDTESQMELLEREVTDGAKGLLVACGPDPAAAEYLAEVSTKVPVVLIGEGGRGELAAVTADSVTMARELADKIASEPGHIALLTRGEETPELARRTEAFLKGMEDNGKAVTMLEPVGGQQRVGHIASLLANCKPQVDLLVVLENDLLEEAVDAVPASMQEVRLCGIGNSDKIVHAMDQGIVTHVVFQNEYAIGYLAVMELANRMGIHKSSLDYRVQYRLVSRETMYQRESEQLLFPIMQ